MGDVLKIGIRSLLLTILLIAATSCTHVLVPIEGPVYRGEKLSLDELKVEVIPGQYYVEFHRDDLYLPVHIIIRNHTDHVVSISGKNFLMLDDVGNKFRPEPLREVLNYYRYVSLYVYPYYSHYDWYYGYYQPSRWFYPHSTYYYLEMIKDTFLESQMLPPGETTSGFVYFKRAAYFADETVTFVAKFAENQMKPIEYVFLID